ncbi:MAG: UDP-N-acetylglucosamine 1-carboxyvinyltransferase [bacterium]|nr:UDP-N-acetylglucosamine 1-carboxyvinyltransferase [bacterium]
MPANFIIEGGKSLKGEIPIYGSKNSSLPLIAASLLSAEETVLENVPEISDVRTMIQIAEKLGAKIEWDTAAKRLRINAKNITTFSPDEHLARKLRGSILFAGSLLGRTRRVVIPFPGGDAIGARPLITHTKALEALGVEISEENNKVAMDGRKMRGNEITLNEPSVTATENTILAAVLAPGKTVIRLAACEPHVQELVLMLQKMGADIKWNGLIRVEINGVAHLSGTTHRINPDELEISGFAALAAATRSELILTGVEKDYLDAPILQLKKMGVSFEFSENTLKILKPAANYKNFRLQSGLYPKLGSDHLPPFAVLATQAAGTTLIHDWLYEDRLRYIPELQKMGADCTILDQHRARITGPTKLTGCDITSADIRSGMTLIIAGLVAEGRTTISHIEHIDRGYAKIDERLKNIGANIIRETSPEIA